MSSVLIAFVLLQKWVSVGAKQAVVIT